MAKMTGLSSLLTAARSGRVIRENGETINLGDLITSWVSFTGTAVAFEATVSFGFTSREVIIINDDASNSLYVSFDGGTTYFTLGAGESLVLQVSREDVVIKGSNCTYRLLAGRSD